MKQIKEFQRLPGKKTMKNQSLKEAVEYGFAKKMDSAYALIARGWGVSFVRSCLRVSRAHLHAILRRSDDWKDGRRSRHTDDTDVLYIMSSESCPRMVIVGYGHCFADRHNLMACLQSTLNVFTGSCATSPGCWGLNRRIRRCGVQRVTK